MQTISSGKTVSYSLRAVLSLLFVFLTFSCSSSLVLAQDPFSPLLEANLITQNIATEGGGVGTYNGAPSIRNNLIISNTATGPSGGALFISGESSELTVTGNTIINNTASSQQGGGIFLAEGDAFISNCILWQNQGDLANISATYSDVTNLTQSPGAGNISSDPLFVQTTNPDAQGYYRLSNTSPCIDVGDPSYQVESDEIDIDGAPRRVARIDIGADELPDVDGPTISNVTFNTNPVTNGMALHDSGTFTLSASDPASVSRIEFSLDGTLIGTDTDGSNNYSCNWDIYQTEDGAHTLTITAYDSLGNARSTNYTVTVALNAPAAPTITSPTNSTTVRTIQITVVGQAGKNTTIQLYNNSSPVATGTVDSSGIFRIPASLSEGVNSLQATATNRAGTSALSTPVSLTLDTSVPKPPVNLTTLAKQGGTTTVTWSPPSGTVVKGYNIYRSSSIFASPQDATKVNTSLVTTTSVDHLPPTDGVYYYGVSTVDQTNQESILSNIASGTSDRTAPRAAITYQPTGHYTSDPLRIAQGLVNVTLTVTESLLSVPFLSMTPNGGVPIPVDLTKGSDTTYTGSFMISESTPSGTMYAVFSARDLVGNRGTTVDTGASFTADTQGPAVTSITVQPASPIKNDTAASVTLTVGLDEPSVSTPVLAYLLSGQGRTQVSVTPTQLSSTSWQAVFTLPADAGTPVENLQLIYQGTDDLSNISTRILCPNSFQVYQGELPSLTAPTNLTGTSLPQGKIKLTWNAVAGASGYQLFRQSPSQSAPVAYQTLGNVVEYTDSPTTDGLYKYAVASIRQENGQQSVSPLSNHVEVVSDATPPGVPQNLSCVLTGSGIKATWEAPAFTEPVTYSLYRSNLPAITSVEGMTPILTSTATTATDPRPSHSDHSYVVTAKDASGNESTPSNSFYLNFDLLPVSSLKVVQTTSASPVITWTHPGGDIAGYNIYLGSEKLNSSLLTSLIYTDTGYAGDERRYTVTAVDRTNRESPGRSITLPKLTATLNAGEKIRRGIINKFDYLVSNTSSLKIDNITIKAQVATKNHRSETFSIDPSSSQTISVPVGGYADLSDLVTLTTTTEIVPEEGSLVQIVRTAQIETIQDTLTLQVANEEFTRGGTGKVWFTLENTGEEEIEVITAKGTSSSDEITFSLRDTDGNVITTMPYKQNTGNVITLANGTTVARIPVGSSFTSNPILLPVPLNAPSSLSARVDISKVHYHYGQTDQVSISGLFAATDIALKDTPYYGEIVSITPQTSTGNEDIVITGRAINRQTSQSTPFVPLKLVITVSGFERTTTVLTSTDGTFTSAFRPPAGESGIYKVRAVHLDVTDKPVMGQFTISKVSLTPSVINLTIPKNYEKSTTIQVSTSEGTEVHNLKIVAADIAGVHLTPGSPVTLGSKQTANLPFTIWADNQAASTATITLTVSSDEATWGTVTINGQFSEAKPALYYTPDHVETGVALNQIVTETITLENKGLADLTDINLSVIPQSGGATPSWVVLNSTQGSLPVGGKRTVSITFNPIGVPEGVYPFYLRVASSNYPTTDIRVYVSVTQSGIGNALFKVSDIYTGTLQNNQLVQGLGNAKITLQNEQVLTIQQIKNTDSLGEALFTGLPTGVYKYRVTSANHQEQIGRLWIKPGITVAEQVFLDYNLVTVEWEVKETTVQDKYEVVLTATYETNVPAAVVAIEPKSITLPSMKAGDIFQGELTITNYGLVRADNVRLTLPATDQRFKYEFLQSVPQTIAAKEKITIPYRVTALQSGDGSGGGCYTYTAVTKVDYTYDCANGQRTARTDSSYFLQIIGVCTSTSPTSPVTINIGGGGAPGGGDSGGGWGGQSSPISGIVCPPERSTPVDCPGDCPPPNRQPVNSDVDVLRGEYIDIIADLFVKVPGHKVEAKRRYYDDVWHFDNDYLKLELAYGNDGSISSIIKDGVRYTKSDPTLFTFKDYRIYVQNGFRFEDKYGNWALYDTAGRMTSYGNPNNQKVNLLYTDNRLTGMTDNSGTQVIWYDYANGLLTSVRDATRRVDYVYTNNKLTKVIDPLLNETVYTYDAQGRLSTKKNAAGRTYTISYNSYGFVKSVLNPEGKGKSFDYGYDAARQERYAQIKYPSGKIIEEWYDRFGEQIRKDLNGRTIKTVLINGRYKTITDAAGNKTYKEYDDRNNLLKQTNPDGTLQTYEYESRFNQVTREVNERGVVTTYQYDANGNTVRKVEAVGTPVQRTTEYTYDSSGNLLTTTRIGDAVTQAATTTMTYDSSGNVRTITDPESNIITFTYDSLGDILTKTDARSKVWTFTYDLLGRLKTQKDPLQNTTTFEYDGVGNKTKETDPEGKQKTYTYDSDNRVLTATDALGNTTRLVYNADGQLWRQIDPENKTITYEYDTDGRLSKTIDGNGNEIVNEYDGTTCGTSCSGTDLPTRTIYPTYKKEFTYDTRGRRTEERDILSDTESYTTKYTYDGIGNILAQTDKENKTTTFTYDALSRRATVKDAALGITEFTYDNRDNLLSLKDAKNQTTLFEYDRNNRVTTETRPMGQATSYTYDGAGNLIRKVDAKNQKIEYGYDDAGRLGTVKHFTVSSDTTPIKTVGFTFDKAGNLKTYNDGVTSGSYTYDDAYRKVSETVNFGSFSLGYAYAYYKNGQKKSFTDPSGVTYEYGYDTNNQPSTLTVPGIGVMTYNRYTWTMPATITLPGGTKKENTYTPLMQPKTIEVKDVAQTSLMAYSYGYSPSGNITSKTTEHGNYGYGYDPLYRLTNATNPTPATETFTYDAAGNRLTSAEWADWTYNSNNELASYDGVVYEYDANGNTTKRTANGQVTNFIYDIDNRLTKITRGDGSTVAEYYYDIFGRRLSKRVGGTTTYYLYADEGLAGEYMSTGTEIKTYGYEPNSTWTTNPVLQRAGANYYWYQNDHLGTPQKMVDGTGRVVWLATSDAFGKATVATSEIENNLRFPGQYYDAETGYHYNWNRYYDPMTGRYSAKDPMGVKGGSNLYLYGDNNPLHSLDPDGLIWVTKEIVYYTWGNWAKWIGNRIAANIGRGMDPNMPGSDPNEYLGMKRDIIQEWEYDSENPCRDKEFPPGIRRRITQTYVYYPYGYGEPTIVDPESTTAKGYTWDPPVPNRTYKSYPGTTYSNYYFWTSPTNQWRQGR